MQKAKGQPVNKNNAYPNRSFLSNTRACLILAFICIMCYGATVFNGYSLDDDLNVTNNAYVQKGIAGIPDILTHPYAAWANKGGDYRPMAAVLYALEQQFFPGNPHVSHVVNILLFMACVFCLFLVLTQVFELQKIHPAIPLLIAAFFAAHPAHTEVVCSIKNREEILSLMFALLALLYANRFLISPGKIQLALLAVLFLFLSFISKLTSLPIIGVFLLWGFYNRGPKVKNAYFIFSAVVIALAICYMAIIFHGIKREFYDLENPLVFNHDISVRLGTAMATLFFYFKFMFIPYPLSFYYGFNTIPMVALSEPVAFFSALIHLAILIYGIRLFIQKRIAGFLIICYFASIFQYSNLAVIYTGIVSERALFFPGVWFLSALILVIFLAFEDQKPRAERSFLQNAFLVIGAVVFTVFTWVTIQRDFEWKSTFSLLSADTEHLQNSTLANFFYASLLQNTGEQMRDTTRPAYLSEAKKYYRRAIAVSATYSEPYYKLGMIYEYDENRNDSAFYYFKKAYPCDTALSPVQFQLGKLYLLQGNYKQSNLLFEMVYKKIPNDTFNLFFYAQGLFFSGNPSAAFSMNDKLLALAPNTFQPYLNRGMFNKFMGNMPAAEPDLVHALQLGCNEPVAFNALLNYYLETGQSDKANQLQNYTRKNP